MELDALINKYKAELEIANIYVDKYQIGYYKGKIELLEAMKNHTFDVDCDQIDAVTDKLNELTEKIIKTDSAKNAALTIAVEECAELIQAITKHARGKTTDTTNLAEEIADVIICISWASVIFNINESEINTWLKFKINRCNERLDNGTFK